MRHRNQRAGRQGRQNQGGEEGLGKAKGIYGVARGEEGEVEGQSLAREEHQGKALIRQRALQIGFLALQPRVRKAAWRSQAR